MPKQVKAVPVEPVQAPVEQPMEEPQAAAPAPPAKEKPAKKRNYTMTPGRAEALRRANEARLQRQAEREEIRRRDEEQRREKELDNRIGAVMERYLSKLTSHQRSEPPSPHETKQVSRGTVARRRLPAMTAAQRRRYEQVHDEDEDFDDEEYTSRQEEEEDEVEEEYTSRQQAPPLRQQAPLQPKHNAEIPSAHHRMYSLIFGR